MKKAVAGIRLALLALANRRFTTAANVALNSAVEAVAAMDQNPQMATRVVRTARGVVKFAVRRIARARV
jgi:hypothetical protein